MNSGIQNHGNLERLVKQEAERYSWKVRIENQDVDPYHEGPFGPKPCPGRGDVVLEPLAGDAVTFEYELPEDPDAIVEQVRSLIGADQIERDRRKAPDRFNEPVQIGDR